MGVRWKQYHAALGPTLKDIPKESWDTVLKEKAADMTHVLDFPYNGEPPKVSNFRIDPVDGVYMLMVGIPGTTD